MLYGITAIHCTLQAQWNNNLVQISLLNRDHFLSFRNNDTKKGGGVKKRKRTKRERERERERGEEEPRNKNSMSDHWKTISMLYQIHGVNYQMDLKHIYHKNVKEC